ncbi:sigma-70 family RNA polymerase sigma factor [Solwaraspora sp. WMMB335]|uniref:RNA polymerase sigma factor n=1 Tax=Solwaraspora sp. WMMB335 TaxID=3404118 RepID=UPI003B92AAC9
MDDRTIVAALVAGDQRGLDGAYRTYADRLYTYCRFLLHDADAAGDAVHDTFVLASQRAAQLRDPDRLRSWLYAIARNECLRTLRARRRQLPLDEAGELLCAAPDPITGLRDRQLRELVWAAAAGLNPGDRQVLELSVRHDLSAAEVGAVLGVSADHAHARLSRVRAQLERAVGALLVARTGSDSCAALGALLDGWDGQSLTVLLRKRVSRHIESCADCADRRREQVHPAALFSAYATAPLLAVPADLWPRLELTCTDATRAADREQIDDRAGRFDSASGFPRPADPLRPTGMFSSADGGRRSRAAGLAAAAVLLLLLGVALVVPRLGAADTAPAGAGQPAPAGAPTLAGSTAEPAPPATAGRLPDPGVTAPPIGSTAPSAAGEPSGDASETPGTRGPTVPPSPGPRLRTDAQLSCDQTGGFTLRVSVAVDEGGLDSAVLRWSAGPAGPTSGSPTGPGGGPGGLAAPDGRAGETPMRVTGDGATGQVAGLTVAEVIWSVTAVTTGGQRVATEPSPATNPCPVRR